MTAPNPPSAQELAVMTATFLHTSQPASRCEPEPCLVPHALPRLFDSSLPAYNRPGLTPCCCPPHCDALISPRGPSGGRGVLLRPPAPLLAHGGPTRPPGTLRLSPARGFPGSSSHSALLSPLFAGQLFPTPPRVYSRAPCWGCRK